MWIRKGIFRDVDGVPAGGSTAAATAADPGAGATPASGSPGNTPVTPFDWAKAGLDPEGLALVSERQFKAPSDVVQSYRNLEKLVGVPPDRIIKLPGEKDPSDSWNAVYDRLGRPKAATDYKIPVPEGDSGEFAKALAPIFHEAGLTQAQVQKLAEKHNALIADQTKQQTTAAEAKHTAEMTALKQEWGPNYDKNNNTIDKAAEQFGMTKEHILGLKQAMGPKAAMQFLLNIGSKIAVEGAFHAGDQTAGFNAMTPEMAQAKIKANTSDRAFAERFNSKDPVVRSKAREEMRTLHQVGYPDQQQS